MQPCWKHIVVPFCLILALICLAFPIPLRAQEEAPKNPGVKPIIEVKEPSPSQAAAHPEREGMVLVPAGPFLMGSNEEGYQDQQPQHEISLDDYWIDKYEVTNHDFARFLNAKGNQIEGGSSWLNTNGVGCHIKEIDGYFKVIAGYETHPVIHATWYGARAYAQWAGKRLPTEAEWEKAASWNPELKKKYRWPWGDTWDSERLTSWKGVHLFTVPVDSHPNGASPYGVFNMAGNVWEWCADWYSHDYYKTSPYKNPTGPVSGEYRVIRGGSWGSYNIFSSTSYRSISQPQSSNFDVGFRCVK